MDYTWRVKAEDYSFTPGDSIKLSVEVINRAPVEIVLDALDFGDLGGKVGLNQTLAYNSAFNLDRSEIVPTAQPFSQPYWLVNESSLGNV